MKDYKRALRRHYGKAKYLRRLNLQVRLWESVYADWRNPRSDCDRLYRPTVALVLGTVYERPFYKWKTCAAPCSCFMCSGHKKYKRDRNGSRRKILQIINDESCSDRIPRIR